MSRLDASQKKWLVDLGVIVGGQPDGAATVGEDSAGLVSVKSSIKSNGKASAKASDAGANAAPAKDGAAMTNWATQRAAAVTALKAVAGKIAAAKHASSAPAVVEIQAVLNKLNVDQPTPQQLTELQRYLGADAVVNDLCELADDIRTPLLGALGQLQTALAA
jgi:hypothetical protein